MKIAMSNDHAGTLMKNEIKAYLESQGHTVVDFGTYDEESCDLSDFVLPAALAVAKGECDRGIFVDGVGYGSAMIANKVSGIYACVCQDPFCAQLARQHNDANVLCLGAKIIGGMIVYQIVHHTAFIGVLAKGIEAYAKNLTASYQNTDIFTKSQMAQVQSAIDSLIDQTKQALPSFFLILPIFAAWILVIACDKTVSRTRPAAQPLRPISHWMMSKPLRNFLLILLIVLLIAQFTVGSGNIYVTTLNNLVDLGFSMMGLSFLYWLFNRRLPKESMGRKVLICIVLLIIPSSAMFLSLIGIVDVYTNMRLIIVLRDSGRRR